MHNTHTPIDTRYVHLTNKNPRHSITSPTRRALTLDSTSDMRQKGESVYLSDHKNKEKGGVKGKVIATGINTEFFCSARTKYPQDQAVEWL